MLKRIGFVILVGAVLLGWHVLALEADGESEMEPRFPVESFGAGWLTTDRNEDGLIDHAVTLDDAGKKLEEFADFNHDGLMDDFLFYDAGVLQRQEIDTNYDRKIDLWIRIDDGVYVAGYERDTDYDGQVDVVKDFGADGEP